MSDTLRLPDWRAVPGIIASATVVAYIVLSVVLSDSVTDLVGYLFGAYEQATPFWMITTLTVVCILMVYSLGTGRKLPRYAMAVVGGVLVVAEFRFDASIFTKFIFFIFVLFTLSSILFNLFGSRSTGRSDDVVRLSSESLFELVASVSCLTLVTGVAVSASSALLFGASPLLGDLAGSRVGIVYLVGPEEAYDEARRPFRTATVAVVFAVIVADAVRHREVRWLTAITLVVGVAGTSFFYYYTLWTATVAAVGALLSVIVLALVLDERTETTLS